MRKSAKTPVEVEVGTRGNGREKSALRVLIRKGLAVTPEGDIVVRLPELVDRQSSERGLLRRLARLRAAGKLTSTKKK